MVAVAPRSTWIHSLLVNALPHRVPVLPSTALAAPNPPSTDDAVAGRPCDSSVPPPPPPPVTVRVAALLTTVPPAFVTATVNRAPLSAVVVAAVVKLGAVAPAMDAPFLDHWYVSVPATLATTLNVAVWPAATVVDAGWVVIVGAATAEPVVHTTPPGKLFATCAVDCPV